MSLEPEMPNPTSRPGPTENQQAIENQQGAENQPVAEDQRVTATQQAIEENPSGAESQHLTSSQPPAPENPRPTQYVPRHALDQRRTIELNLMGQKILLRTQADSELTDAVTRLVQERLSAAEARMRSGVTAPHLPAVLALFDLAEEYIEAKRRVEAHQGEVNEKLARIRTLIEE